jgi:hypothetical protein
MAKFDVLSQYLGGKTESTIKQIQKYIRALSEILPVHFGITKTKDCEGILKFQHKYRIWNLF